MEKEIIIFEPIREWEQGPEYVLRLRALEQTVAQMFGVPAKLIEGQKAGRFVFGSCRIRAEPRQGKRP
jgi:hypothetical protein